MTTNIAIYDDPQSIAPIVPAWKRLLAQTQCFAAFSGPEWLLGAASAFDQRPHVLAAWEGQTLVALLPAVARVTPRGRTVEFPFSISADWLDLLVAPDHEPVAQALVEFFFAGLRPGDRLRFANIPRDGALIGAFSEAIDKVMPQSKYDLAARRVPYVALPDLLETYLASKSKNFRKDLRRNAADFSALGLRVVELPDPGFPMESLVEFFLASFAERFGDASIYASPAAQRFCRSVFPALIAQGAMSGFLLVDAGRTVRTFSLEARRGNENLAFHDAYDLSLREHGVAKRLYSVGLERSIARGFTLYDLSRVPNQLKDRFKTGERFSYEISATWP